MRFWGLFLSAAGVTGAEGFPAPIALVTSAAPVACSLAMPAPGASTLAGAATETASSGRCDRVQESSRPEKRRRQSSGRGKSRSGGKRGASQSPSPARSARSASVSAFSSSGFSDSEGRASAMPPPPSRRHSAGGGHFESVCSASGCARSPQPGFSSLGSGKRAAPHTDRSRSALHSRSSPSPLGAGEGDRDSVSNSIDLDRDDSFRTVLRLIREFRSMEELASVAPNHCKTSLAPIYGLQSVSSLALHLPLSPLLGSLLEDTNLALVKFVENQTVHGFLPVPGRRHRTYYRTFPLLFLACIPSRLDWPLSPWTR